jgi:hypothetical protein
MDAQPLADQDASARLRRAEYVARRMSRASAALYLAAFGANAFAGEAGWKDDALEWLAQLVHDHAETVHAMIEGREPGWRTDVPTE